MAKQISVKNAEWKSAAEVRIETEGKAILPQSDEAWSMTTERQSETKTLIRVWKGNPEKTRVFSVVTDKYHGYIGGRPDVIQATLQYLESLGLLRLFS